MPDRLKRSRLFFCTSGLCGAFAEDIEKALVADIAPKANHEI